ncbi:putative WD repeat-containing protein [Colletotrichum siamense]|uniref:WD repeat-containing protein n=1 Tax=Colletotrichum siamense TaxID=690259 RepID=A0A9P5K8X0_COLSI|nr:putative WD repeat-containing protein [Colletotrichum siamense]KAF4849769.1 putative WD repeat-containing protein [Colletotrichum siamense]KAF4863614.1 putative WD repeat-containing protein [Colletotrichum siamense]
MSAHNDDHEEPEMLGADEVGEEVNIDNDDVAMDSDDDNEEITLHNDSVAYFDAHKDSVFTIAQHPIHPTIIATGGSEGDSDDAPGKGYLLSTAAAASRPVLPASFSGETPQQSTSLDAIYPIDGHTDSINAMAFTLPKGDFLVSGGMDGKLRVHAVRVNSPTAEAASVQIKFIAEAQEVPEINWIAPCPSPQYPNTIALGASDNSVWVYTIDIAAGGGDPANCLQLVQTYWLHQAPCTAGAWTPDGSLLCTVAEDSSLYVWDVWGEAAAKGLVESNGQTTVSMTAQDQRFEVEGGLYSVAVDPKGALVAVGGAGGAIRIVSLPRLASSAQAGKGGKSKTAADVAAGGQILASLQTASDGIETLSFTVAAGGPGQASTLLAAGSVDGSIAVFDAGRRFAVRRSLPGAHEDFSVVKVEFVKNSWLLTSCGMDGVVRRWDLRAADAGLVKEWKGHMGGGEGGGVLGFVQGETGERVVTAGDDGVVLVFEA